MVMRLRYCLKVDGYIDADFVELPPLTLKHIHQYFITGRLQKECVTATKPFERGYKLFDAKKVQCLSLHNVTAHLSLLHHPCNSAALAETWCI